MLCKAPSLETMSTGRRRACSWPTCGSGPAQKMSPRFTTLLLWGTLGQPCLALGTLFGGLWVSLDIAGELVEERFPVEQVECVLKDARLCSAKTSGVLAHA